MAGLPLLTRDRLLPLALFFALLFFSFFRNVAPQSVDVGPGAPDIGSAFVSTINAQALLNYGSMLITFNATTGEYDIKPTEDVGQLTFVGRNGDSADFMVINSVRPENNSSNFRIVIEDINVSYDLAVVGYIPRKGGSMVQESFGIESTDPKTQVESLLNLNDAQGNTPVGDTTSPGSNNRRRDYVVKEALEVFVKLEREKGAQTKKHPKSKFTGPIGDYLVGAAAVKQMRQGADSEGAYYDTRHPLERKLEKIIQDAAHLKVDDSDREKLFARREVPAAAAKNKGDNFDTSRLMDSLHIELLRKAHGLAKDAPLPRDDEYLYKVNGRWMPASTLNTRERFKARIQRGMTVHLADFIHTAQMYARAQDDLKHGRSRRALFGGGISTANSAGTAELLAEVGGVCESLKYGGGIVRGIQDKCVLDVLTHLNGKIGANDQVIADLVETVNKLVDAGVETAAILEEMSIIVGSLQDQVVNQQRQLDIVNGELLANLGRFDAITRNAHEAAMIDELTRTQIGQAFAGIAMLNAALNANAEATDAALRGVHEMVNENTVEMQAQMVYMERQMKAYTQREIQAVYITMATMQQKIIQAINIGLTDTDIRLSQIVESINFSLDEVYGYLEMNTGQLKTHGELLGRIYDSLLALYNHEFQDGDVNWQYWLMKNLVLSFDNGTYIPYVFEGTGRPPVNVTHYTAREGRTLEFSGTNVAQCEISSAKYVQVQQYVDASLKQNALIDVLLPLGLHPSYFRYSVWLPGVPALQPADAKLYHGIVYTQPNPGEGPTTAMLMTYDGVVLQFIPDTPDNRNAPFVMRWFTASSFNLTEPAIEAAVRDGQDLYLYAFAGSISYMVGYTQGADIDGVATFDFDIDQVSGGSYTPTVTNLRQFFGDDVSQRDLAWLEGRPFSYNSSARPFPGQLNTINRPSDPLPFYLGSGANWVRTMTFVAYQPPSNSSGLVDELLNSAVFNSTVQNDFAAPYRGQGMNTRKKRSVPASSPISVATNRVALYRELTGAQKAAVEECTLGQGGMSLYMLAPEWMVLYENDDFTGASTQQLPNSNGQTVYSFGGKAQSVIVPPSLSVGLFVGKPPAKPSDTCKTWKFACKYYLQDPRCIDSLMRHNNWVFNNNRINYCKDHGFVSPEGTVGQIPPRDGDGVDPIYSALTNAEYTARDVVGGRSQGCAFTSAGYGYTMFCIMADGPDTWTGPDGRSDRYRTGNIAPMDSTANKNICYQTRFGSQNPFVINQRIPDNLALFSKAMWPDDKQPVIDVVAHSPSCVECQTGYGQLKDGVYVPVNSECNPIPSTTPNTTVGNDTGPYRYHVNDPDDRIQVKLTVVGGPAQNFWQVCVPPDPALINIFQNTKYPNLNLPYFFTPGDIGDSVYNPMSASVLITFPACDQITVGQCDFSYAPLKTGQWFGYCEKQIDNNATIATPMQSQVITKCGYVSQSPCLNVSTADACIQVTQLNSNSGEQIPVCMWSNVNGSCMALASNFLGVNIEIAAPETITTTNVFVTTAVGFTSRYTIPCAYRVASRVSCTFDDRCMVYFPNATMTTYGFCVPFNFTLLATLINTTAPDLPSSQAASIALLADSGVDWPACGNLYAGCILRNDRAHIRLQYLLTNAMNVTEPTYCGLLEGGVDLRAPCSWKYLFIPQGNWTFPFAPQLAADHLVPFCRVFETLCKRQCRVYDLDQQKCIGGIDDFDCFVSAFNNSCLDAGPTARNAVCGGQASSPYDIGSPCIQKGNACGLLRADYTLNGVFLNFTDNGNITANYTDMLYQSECAQIAGYQYGNLSNAALVSRLDGVTLPNIINRGCTAIVTEQSAQCMESAYVAGCVDVGPVCDLKTDLILGMDNLIKQTYCTYGTLGECIMGTRDNVFYPCAWIRGNPGVCVTLPYAQNAMGTNSRVKIWTKDTYQRDNRVVAARSTSSWNGFMAAGVDPTTFRTAPADATLARTVPLQLGPVRIVCTATPNLPLTRGYVCCSDPTCQVWERNPLHPKMLHAVKIAELCHDPMNAVINTKAAISYAGIKHDWVTLFQNQTFNGTGYVIEPFVSTDGAQAFPFFNQGERGPTPVIFTPTETRNLIPLRWYPELGPPSGQYRQVISPYNISFSNTVFAFDGYYRFSSTAVNNPRGYLVDANITEVAITVPSQTNGVYVLSTQIMNTLEYWMKDNIDTYVDLATKTGGPNYFQTDCLPDFGVKKTTSTSTATMDGLPASKVTTLTAAYGTKIFDLPIYSAVSYSISAMVRKYNANGIVQAASKVVIDTSNFANLLVPLGQPFVYQVDRTTGKTISIPTSFIGLNQCGKVGYLYTAQPTDNFNLTDYYSGGPTTLYDASCATAWAGQFELEFPVGATPGGPEEGCGQLAVTISSGSPSIEQITLETLLNYPILDAEARTFWTNVTSGFGGDQVLRAVSVLQEIWYELGCTGELQNFIDPGNMLDTFRMWLVNAYLPLTGTLDRAVLTSLMAPYAASKNRIMCNNCLFIKNPSTGAFVYPVPGVDNACNPALGEEPAPFMITKADFDSTRMTRTLTCAGSATLNTVLDEDNLRLIQRVNPGLAQVTATFTGVVVDTLRQYISSPLCVLPANGTIVPGGYQVAIVNPYTQISVGGIMRIRQNISELNTPVSVNTGCASDNPFSLPPFPIGEALYTFPLCAGDNYIGLYALNGESCEFFFNASLTYTASQLNLTENIIHSESSYNTAIRNVTVALDNSYQKLNEETRVALNRTIVEVAAGFAGVNGTLVDLKEQAAEFEERSNEFNSSIINLDQEVEFLGSGQTQINETLIEVVEEQGQQRELIDSISNRTTELQNEQNKTQESLNELNNLTDYLYNQSTINQERIDNITKRIDGLQDMFANISKVIYNATSQLERAQQTETNFSIGQSVALGVLAAAVIALLGVVSWQIKKGKTKEKTDKAAEEKHLKDLAEHPPQQQQPMMQPPQQQMMQPQQQQQPYYGQQQPYYGQQQPMMSMQNYMQPPPQPQTYMPPPQPMMMPQQQQAPQSVFGGVVAAPGSSYTSQTTSSPGMTSTATTSTSTNSGNVVNTNTNTVSNDHGKTE